MLTIRYSEDFYVNGFPNRGEEYAKGHIEAFMKKMPHHLVDYLEKKNYFGESEPEFQAVIIGEPKISMFGKPQVAVVMIHSNFIAYTTAFDYQSPINRTYGYATFDNKLAITRVFEHLEFQSTYETLVVGYGTETIEADYDKVLELIEKNTKTVENYFEQLEAEEEAVERLPAEESSKGLHTTEEELTDEEDDSVESIVEMEPLEAEMSNNGPDAVDEITAEIPKEKTVDIVLEEEWLTDDHADTVAPTADHSYEEEAQADLLEEEPPVMDDANAQVPTFAEDTVDREKNPEQLDEEVSDAMDEKDERDLEDTVTDEAKEYPINEEYQKDEELQFVPPVEGKKPLVDTSRVDARFSSETLIISNNSIPNGFVFREPVVYAYSARAGVFKNSTPRRAYVEAYETCLDMIRDDIADGRFDAVFNLQFNSQSVDNYYEVVLTGDGVVYQKED